MKPDPGWKREFNDPIPLPRGRQLITLEDAGNYIAQLRKAVHEAPEWQAATEALLLVVTLGGPTMFARIGMMKALNPNVDRTFDSSRKETHWGKRELKRDADIGVRPLPEVLADLVEGMALPSTLALLLRSDLRSARHRRFEDRLELGPSGDLAADVADNPTEPAA